MSSSFENVIKEFHKRRLEKEINAEYQRNVRMQELYRMAEQADQEMKRRRRRKKQA